MFYCQTEENQYVFKQGDQGTCFFIIKSGQCNLIINNQIKKKIQKGQYFGEYALLYGAQRSGSIKTLSKCGFWGIDRASFKIAVQEISQKFVQQNKAFLNINPFFCNQQQKQSVANLFNTEIYKKGNVIVQQGDQANSFYVIKKGYVNVIKNGMEIHTMGPSQCFGQKALLKQGQKRSAKIIALDQQVVCISVGRQIIRKCLGCQVQRLIFNNTIKIALQNDQSFKILTKEQIQLLMTKAKIIKFDQEGILFNQNQICNKIVIPLDTYLFQQNGQIFLERGKIFQPKYKVKQNLPKFQTKIKADKGNVGLFNINDFQQIIQICKKYYQKIQKFQTAKKIQQNQMKLQNFYLIKRLGVGQFGKVYLVKDFTNGNYYAIKTIQKNQINLKGLYNHIKQQKQVLQIINFPFIVKYLSYIEDNQNIYFVTQYIPQIEFFDAIRQIGLLTVSQCQFYLAILILCIQYLHSLNIIYRDIKPQNIMVEKNGYIKLIDMGTAKLLTKTNSKKLRTKTIIGTPHYMAPQIITGKGYTFYVDLWSLGILLFQLLFGYVPFAQQLQDPFQIYQDIISKNIPYPKKIDKKTKLFLDQLLNKVPQIRLGGNYISIKSNLWFNNIQWNNIQQKTITAPYIPKTSLTQSRLLQLQNKKITMFNFMKNDHKYKLKWQQ